MSREDISRREFIAGASLSGFAVVAAGAGPASAANTERSIVGTSTKSATDKAKKQAESVHRVLEFGDIGDAVAGKFSEEALENLEKNPNVRYTEADGQMEAIGETLPWGIDRVDADEVHADGETGGDDTDGEGGADIAIIDTGIDDDHPDLQANVGSGKAYVNCRGSNCNYPWSDDDNHGTHCAGTADAVDNSKGVIGVSTAATLHAVKVLDNSGSGSFSDVAAGIEYTADQGWDVGSMSLGASSGSQTVKDACQYAYDKGVLLVAAAGNDGPCSDCVGYPAAYSTVIAVSSTDSDDTLSSFSSTGSEVELAAPGGDVYSTVIGGYDTYSGTSMACPHVSGAGAQLMDNGYTNTEARDQLTSTAENIGLSSNEQGNGLLDVAAALGGSTDGAPTVDSLSASEVETSDGDAEFDADWSVSDADGDLSSVDLVLTQDSDGSTEDSATVSVSGDTASGTTRLVAAGDDGSGNSYTVEATVTDGAGNTGSDTASVSETESTSSAPAIDTFSLTDNSNPAWERYTVDWAVSDSDGDLSSVTVEMLDSGGSVLDSASTSVSGSSASGSDEVRTKGNAAEIELTVTDDAGNSTADSKSV
ncbi:serine protease [Halobacteriales archaeon QS_4_69_31]|nr:MAG: serine protease [Halobacteriales archaeon QS_4_69_31]